MGENDGDSHGDEIDPRLVTNKKYCDRDQAKANQVAKERCRSESGKGYTSSPRQKCSGKNKVREDKRNRIGGRRRTLRAPRNCGQQDNKRDERERSTHDVERNLSLDGWAVLGPEHRRNAGLCHSSADPERCAAVSRVRPVSRVTPVGRVARSVIDLGALVDERSEPVATLEEVTGRLEVTIDFSWCFISSS